MPDHPVERKLAAILAADVVGYSRLMGRDEAGTLQRLRTHCRELIDPKAAERKGHIVKTTGDGMLIEFPSIVEAVACAVAVQRGMAERNVSTPEDQRIVFRVGVNLGDIIIDGDDIHGDGVNIAARLEGLAEPGGICVSAIVHDQIRDKLDLTFDDVGEQSLKNIARALRVFRVRPHRVPASAAGPALALPDKPSIAVLPFQNMSGDPEQEYFADGMVEEIITGLSRIKWLFVIARNSSFVCKGKAVDVRQVGRELGVRYVLEGPFARQGTACASPPNCSNPKPGHIFGPTDMTENWRTFSTCRIRSPKKWSGWSSRACGSGRLNAPGESVPKISTPMTSICALCLTWRLRCLRTPASPRVFWRMRSGWTRTTPPPLPSSPGATRFASCAGDSTRLTK